VSIKDENKSEFFIKYCEACERKAKEMGYPSVDDLPEEILEALALEYIRKENSQMKIKETEQ